MGSNASILLQKEDIKQIEEETGFSANQIKRLYSRFTSLDKNNNGVLNKDCFSRIPELHVNPLRDRILEVLIDDNGSDGTLNFKQFAKVLSTFRRTKDNDSKEKKLKFLFRVYDRDNDNKINKTELLNVLHMMVGDNIPQEQLTAIAERTITELDSDGDMVITFEEFCRTLDKIDIDDKMSMKFLA